MCTIREIDREGIVVVQDRTCDAVASSASLALRSLCASIPGIAFFPLLAGSAGRTDLSPQRRCGIRGSISKRDRERVVVIQNCACDAITGLALFALSALLSLRPLFAGLALLTLRSGIASLAS